MKRAILILVLAMLLLSPILAANLGVYHAGDTVTYSVVCLTDEGTKDTACGTSDDDILDPDDTTAKAPTSALAEVSDANFPGLWRGSYLIPASPLKGTWSIFIELTNTNSTTAATVLNFQVLTDYFATQGDLTSGIVVLTSATETQIDNIETDTAALDTSTELRTLLTGSDTAVSTLTTSDNIGINWGDISNPTTVLDLAGTIIKTVDTCSALTANNDKTGYTLSLQDWTTDSDLTNLKSYGDSNWSTSTSGLSAGQNTTLYNTYAVVGTKDKYDQSIADMIAYNASDGNVETDLDTAGGTTPAAVWGYNITGGSSESAAWYITTIKTIVEWIERFF